MNPGARLEDEFSQQVTGSNKRHSGEPSDFAEACYFGSLKGG